MHICRNEGGRGMGLSQIKIPHYLTPPISAQTEYYKFHADRTRVLLENDKVEHLLTAWLPQETHLFLFFLDDCDLNHPIQLQTLQTYLSISTEGNYTLDGFQGR